MNQTEIIKFVNEILGTNYINFGQVRPLDIARVDLAMQMDAHLRARVSPEQPDIAPRVVHKFSDLDDGATFSYPLGGPVYPARYEKDTSQTAQRDCHCCGMARANARSIERAGAPWHFCPDDLVLPVKDAPGGVKFYTLEPGDTFLVVGHQGDGAMTKTVDGAVVTCAKCYYGAFKNARTDDDVSRHICPDTLVVELPIKDKPKDSHTLFYKLDPGDSFLVPGGREGPHEKLSRYAEGEKTCCRSDNCPLGEAWLNARNMIGTFVHICPDTLVLPVPF